jgi:hypothetical protein
MFGGLNTLFSGFAFAGLIITILMQMEELGLSREEMRLTREEIKKGAEAQIKSQENLANQIVRMEQNARLDSLNYFIGSVNKNASTIQNDKKEVAKRILEDLIESIFYENQYVQLAKPSLLISYDKPKMIFSNNITRVRFVLKNNGLQLDNLKIETDLKNGFEGWVNNDLGNSRIGLFWVEIPMGENKIHNVVFTFRGLAVAHIWERQIHFEVIDSEVTCRVSKTNLVFQKMEP